MSNKYKSSAHLSPLNIIINGQSKGYTERKAVRVRERERKRKRDCPTAVLLLVAGVGKWRIPKWECL